MNRPILRIDSGSSFQAAQVERRTLAVPAAPRGFDRLKLLFMTDLHMSAMFPEAAMERLMVQAQALEPDVLLIGGDLAETAADQARAVALLGGLRPPLGAFAVMGNNDCEHFEHEGVALPRALRRAGITPLIDSEAWVRLPGGRLFVAGLNSLTEKSAPPKPFFASSRKNDLRVLLAHYPKSILLHKDNCARPPHLALAGHTHGGQFRLLGITPYSIGFELLRTYRHLPISGWTDYPGFPLLVSPGVGASRLPFRLNVPPAIHLITIQAGA